MAAFSQAVYLKTDAGGLFWLVTPDAPMHRRAAQVNGGLPICSSSSRYCVQSNRATMGGALMVDLEHSEAWRAPQTAAMLTVPPSELSRRVQDLFYDLDLSNSAGFGAFIPHIMRLACTDFPLPGSACGNLVLERAEPFVLGAARACRDSDPDALCTNAVALIGLGGGLTPSGDDFAGGLLFCLKHLGLTALSKKLHDALTRPEFLGIATNEISAAILIDLVAGHAVAPLHETVNRLLLGEAKERIHPFVSQLTSLGHSTGWDLLAGVFTGLLAVRSLKHGLAVTGVTACTTA